MPRRPVTRVVTAALVGLAAVLAVAGAVWAQDAADLAKRMDALRSAAADRDLPQVERLAGALIAERAGTEAAGEARILLGKTRLGGGRADEAIVAVDPLLETPGATWHVKALYVVAAAAAQKRDWQRAADIYAQRVEWAASPAHAGEVAALYREIADVMFAGAEVEDEYGRTKRVPDWATARRFYEKARAVQEGGEADDRALVTFRIGLSALESGDAAAAVRELDALLETEAGDVTDDALYALGRARVATGDRAGARTAFADLRERFGDSEFASLALIRVGESWLTDGSAETAQRAVEPWREFLRLYFAHDEAPNVRMRVAEVLRDAGRAAEASEEFTKFVAEHPDDKRAPAAQDQAARALLGLDDFDGAVGAWRVLLDRWPDHPLWAEAQRSVAAASFRKGLRAIEEKHDAEATTALTAFLEAYPVDEHAPQAQRLLGDIDARAERHTEAVAAWRLCATKYPQSADAPAAMLLVAGAYEGPLADLEQALAAYEETASRWPGTSQANEARRILAEMKGRHLRADIDRPFRTDEEPVVKMSLRNVPTLRMKAYRIEPGEYVRRRGGLAGVEKVDVDVVKPDHAWDWEVPDYARYRLLERNCPLPFRAPGAYIVTAADDELTATFLAVISDLTVILKSSDSDGLVFVYDERTGQPVGGAGVHVLDGDLHGVTASDGVWRERGKGLARLRAVVTGGAAHPGHFAYAESGAGRGVAFGYTTKVFLQTDRPLYRGGQTVALRAIVRRVTDGHYVTEPGLKVPVKVFDPRGATLFEEELVADAYGVIAAELDLAPEPALGTHTVRADLDGRTFQQTFEVEAFRKPDILVAVAPSQQSYLSGETVDTTVSLRYAVGGVAAGVPVRWAVFRGPYTFDASAHEAFAWFFRDAAREEEQRRQEAAGATLVARGRGETDLDGRIAITFATDTVEEDRTYTVVAEAQDPSRRWVRSSTAVPVTQRAVYVMCRTEKKVVRPGETFALEATVVNALHVPVAAPGRGVLVRRVRVDEHWVEEDVSTTDAPADERGRAVVEMRAPRAGTYLARFVVRDASGRDVVGAAEVTVSGDAEDLDKHARLVADREFYREGDVAKVLVNVPSAPVPVLLTYEGERVLEHVVFMATERSSTVELPLRAEHAPNVFLRMAVAKNGELYQDGDEVAVFQYLDVSVTPDKPEYRPGEKIMLTVRTTDQSGKPVRAAVGVDVVDAAIYALAPDGIPQVKPFFYDQRRMHAVGTASSAGLTLPSLTRPTNPDLLFERMRRLGKERFEKMQGHVVRGRELAQQGQRDAALEELRRALEIEPGNYEARGLVDALTRADKLAEKKSKSDLMREPSESADMPPTAPATRAPRPAGDAKDEIGIGGGAGGAFGGRRGGRRNLRASGGGGKAGREQDNEDDRDAAGMFFNSNEDGDFRARTESVFKSLSNWAASPELQASVLIAQAALPMLPAELRERFEDTAHTQPRVETGPDGTARVTFELPDNLTEWRVTARGASAGPLVGEARSSFLVSKPLLVRADAPRFLVSGDTTTATGTVHSSLPVQVQAVIALRSLDAPVTGTAQHEATLDPGTVTPFEVDLTATPTAGLARFRAEVTSTVPGDASVAALPVLPRGLRRIDGASGVLVEEAFAELELPERVIAGTESLVVTLSPSIDIALLESLAYTSSYPYGCVEQTVNRFLPALAAREALESSGSAAFRTRAHLDESVRRGLAALYSLQLDDGSFGWFGLRGRGDVKRAAGGDAEMTAYAVLGMLRAEKSGFSVSLGNRDRAVAAAQQLVRGASAEERAFLLYALSFAGKADLADLNALHRERAALSPRALALLALAMQRTDRATNASELIRRLETLAVRDGGSAHWDSLRKDEIVRFLRRPVRFRDAEPTAYALLALIAVEPTNPLVDEAAAWLATTRRGPAWSSTRDTAAAIEALAAHAALRGVESASGTVEIEVNGGAPISASFGSAGGRPVDAPVSVEIPAASLRPGKNRVVLRRRGTGRVHWSAMLSAAEAPPVTGAIEAGGNVVTVARDFTVWVPPALPGETVAARVAPGYSVVKPESRPPGWFGRPLDTAGTGDKVLVTLRLSSRAPLDRVIVEDPLPAGCEVVTDSATGPFDRQERRDDRQVFFLSKLREDVTLSYVVQAIHPGSYDVLPAAARAMYEPELNGWSREQRLDVAREPGLANAAPTPDQITPDEIWGFAQQSVERGDWAAVRGAARGLIDDVDLRPEIEEQAWALLFRAGMELDDAALIAKAYEEILDRNPRIAPTGMPERSTLARAYRTLGEHERALTVLRDLVREHFAMDREAADAFASVGNPWRARDLLSAALRRVPDAEWVAAEQFALAQRTAGMHVVDTGAAGPLMLTDAVEDLRAFEAHHAESRLAHEAGHLTVQLLLKMDLQADAIEAGTRFRARHAASKYLDDVTYLVAEGEYEAGAFDRALAATRPLLDETFPVGDDPKVREVSPFRPRAVHLTAKIAHARGELVEAAKLYAQVAHLFTDARDAHAFLTATGLTLREVESVAVGGAPELHLRRRNVESVRFEVYAVDFMILYALRPDLSQVNRIDLSGVQPVDKWTLEAAGQNTHRWSEETVRVPVSERGVYLIVARSGALDASSVVLVSDLEVDVQQVDGAVRVYASDRRTGLPAPEVYVKVGDGQSIKAQGFTDARGVLEAGKIGGTFSVVAEKDGNVALWRR